MYKRFRELCERWLRLPAQPEPPLGDEATAIVFRASPKFLMYLRITWALRNGVGLIFLLGFLGFFGFGLGESIKKNHTLDDGGDISLRVIEVVELIGASFVAFRVMTGLALLQLDYDKRWYIVTDRSLRIREGVINVREITFTFANIQNLSVTQGPVQRWLGIADLKVETAGGGGAQVAARNGKQPMLNLHVAYFRGIDNATEVREIIGERMRGHRDAGLGDHEDAHLIPVNNISKPATSMALEDALAAVLEEARGFRAAAQNRRGA